MRVVITGASSGLGEALAREYAARAQLAASPLTLGLMARRGELLQALAGSLRGVEAVCIPVDVTDRAALARAASAFLDVHGAPDVVVANAGVSAGTLTDEPGDGDEFERILLTNLRAMYDTFAAFLPAMQAARRGALVGVASVAGFRGLPGAGGYSASKAGAIAYLESLRVELRASPIDVVTIAPGYVRTPMTEHNPYPMPFMLDADIFARRAVDAIERRRSFAVIPWQMGWVGRGLRLMPNALYDRLFAHAPRKPRRMQPAGD